MNYLPFLVDMFWSFYIFFSAALCFLLTKLLPRKYRASFSIIYLTLFLTPSQIELGSNNYAPAFFIFFYNAILELNFSLRPLRALMLTLPINLLLFISLLKIKKRFS
tara:strand:+ start:1707 stop:2027 length:321 start_codon:yes stop_codon:yes gene_type:complete